MIKGITGGNFINVVGGHTSGPYISPGSSGAGMMRYNGNTQTIEVNDGNVWQVMSSAYPSVELNGRAVSILEWAEQKMAEEKEIEELAKNHPAVKAALEAVHRAQDQLKLIRDLSIEHEPS